MFKLVKYPDEKQDLEFALVYSPTKVNGKNVILAQLKVDVLNVKMWYAQNSFPSCSNLPLGVALLPNSNENDSFVLFPNPSSGKISIASNLKFN
ncbi:MAG: hypothetical protein SGJ00_10035 [bacterium]|nr:hypothetical protein [bacterium]